MGTGYDETNLRPVSVYVRVEQDLSPSENNPDMWCTLEESSNVEVLVSSGFYLWHDATNGGCPASALSTAADEGSVSRGCCGVYALSSEPRGRWVNRPSWRYSQTNWGTWKMLLWKPARRAGRSRLIGSGATLGAAPSSTSLLTRTPRA